MLQLVVGSKIQCIRKNLTKLQQTSRARKKRNLVMTLPRIVNLIMNLTYTMGKIVLKTSMMKTKVAMMIQKMLIAMTLHKRIPKKLT